MTSVVATPNGIGKSATMPCLPFSKDGVILAIRRSPRSKYVPVVICDDGRSSYREKNG